MVAMSHALLTLAAAMQVPTAIIRVSDNAGTPIPYAVVALEGSTPVVADDSGRAILRTRPGGPLKLWVRRIGYQPFSGVVATDPATLAYQVRLVTIARHLDAVLVAERQVTPLSRTGFYQRIERVRRGAIVAEFITPEDLEARTASQSSDYLRGRRYVTVSRSSNNKPLLTGRGGCAMTIIIDGQRANGTAQDIITAQSGPQSIVRGGQYVAPAAAGMQADRHLPSIDDLIVSRDVMAIEIYTSMANAPAELVQLTGGGSCGLVAIWTGPRR